MPNLVARSPILYLGKMYRPGDLLPVNNRVMIEAWLSAKTAEWDAPVEEMPTETVVEPAPRKRGRKR